MGRKKGELVVEIDGGAAEEVEEGNLFDRLAEDAYVLFHRRDERTKEWVYQGRLAPAEAQEEYIAATYGGGEYRCRERVKLESGRFGYGRQRVIKIGGPYKGVPIPTTTAEGKVEVGHSVEGGRSTPPANPNMSDVVTAGVIDLLKMSRETSAVQMEALRSTVEAGRAPRTDWAPILTVVLPSVMTFLTAMMQVNAGKRDPVEIATELMAKLQPAAPANPLKERLEEMKLLREVGDVFGGGGGGDESWPSLIGKMGPSILEAMQGAAAKDAARGPAAVPVPPARQVAPPKEASMFDVVKGYLPTLVKHASAGRDANVYAQVIVDTVPEPMRPALTELVSRPNIVPELATMHAGVAEHEEWFGELMAALRGLLHVSPPIPSELPLPTAPSMEPEL